MRSLKEAPDELNDPALQTEDTGGIQFLTDQLRSLVQALMRVRSGNPNDSQQTDHNQDEHHPASD